MVGTTPTLPPGIDMSLPVRRIHRPSLLGLRRLPFGCLLLTLSLVLMSPIKALCQAAAAAPPSADKPVRVAASVISKLLLHRSIHPFLQRRMDRQL